MSNVRVRVAQTLQQLQVLLVALLLTVFSGGLWAQPAGVPSSDVPGATAIAAEMYPGWNLGNTLEASPAPALYQNLGVGTETAWQSTPTTRQLLALVRSLGFRSVRIPCNWVNGHIVDSLTTTVDPAWMARVRQIVDDCLAEGLYVVLNDHYDGGWLEQDGFLPQTDVDAKTAQLERLWTQIAQAFRDYDHRLLFAGLNEPFHDHGTDSLKAARLLHYEQVFVNAVRRVGGCNATRTLVVQGPETNIDRTLQYFTTLPADPAGPGRLMLEVHYYDPWQFCGLEQDESWGRMAYYYNAENYVDGSNRNAPWGDGRRPQEQMQRLKAQFVDRGVPVIIGEFGANWREMPEGESQEHHDASIRAFFSSVTRSAIDCGCVPFVWDINATRRHGTRGTMTIVHRYKQRVYCQPAADGVAEGVAAAHFGEAFQSNYKTNKE